MLGIALARTKRTDEAVRVIEGLARRQPDYFDALTWLATILRGNGRITEAREYANRALALRPNDPTAHAALGDCLLSNRECDQAIQAFEAAIELAPGAAEFHHNLGLACLIAGRDSRAVGAFRRSIELKPKNSPSFFPLIDLQLRHAQIGQAMETIQLGFSNVPDAAGLHVRQAAAFARVQNGSAAESCFLKAIELSAKTRPAFAAWLQEEGRFDEAAHIFRAMLEDEETLGQGFHGLSQISRLDMTDTGVIESMERRHQEGRLDPTQQMFLSYGLAKVFDRQDRCEKSMAMYDEANRLAFRLYNSGVSFDVTAEERRIEDEMRRVSQAPSLDEGAGAKAIFIVGMIRSGTTLLEQIVSSHPEVAPTGELRFWLEEGRRLLGDRVPTTADLARLRTEYLGYAGLLNERSAAFTDKMPLNYQYLGLIARALPQAKVIHIRRNPIDTCLSIYTTYFGKGPEFAYDRNRIVAAYRLYQDQMARWRNCLPPGFMIEADYEALVTDREATTRKIIEFCRLPWNDACLKHERNASPISTPSRWQARQPIYRTSLERWRRFENSLGQFASLSPTLQYQ